MGPIVKQSINTSNVLCVILGGGQGKRLFPLTRDRAKPAVPLAGKYRLVDVPISNCINSGFRRIYVLTQYNSVSLHRHIAQTYNFDAFSGGFVEILAAQQTAKCASWFEGTADAVRKNLEHFLDHDFDYLLVLSGDQLYRMDFRLLILQHMQSGADITISTIPMPREKVPQLGIMRIDSDRRIRDFAEKPTDPELIARFKLPQEWYAALGIVGDSELYLASMGIYVFNRDVIQKVLAGNEPDFGRDIIPHAIKEYKVYAYIFQGYWEDIGTIKTFFEANLDAASELPRFNFFDMTAPIFTRARFLPCSKVNGATLDHALISEGCIINRATLIHCVIGLRSIIEEGAVLRRVVLMGIDYYETEESKKICESKGIPKLGIGRNTRIEETIIDKNVRIGDNVVITPHGKPANFDHELYYIRDGIVVIPRGATIPHGTVI